MTKSQNSGVVLRIYINDEKEVKKGRDEKGEWIEVDLTDALGLG